MRDNVSQKKSLLPRAERAEAGWSGQLSYPNQTSRTTQLPRTAPQSAWTLSLRSFSMSEEGGSSWSSRPCRHHLALLFALLTSRTETGAEPEAREAHGLQPNSRPVPSRKSARESRKTRSDKVFRWALRDGIPSGRSEVDLSLSGPPPARFEAPGPPCKKQKHMAVTAVTQPLQPLHTGYST